MFESLKVEKFALLLIVVNILLDKCIESILKFSDLLTFLLTSHLNVIWFKWLIRCDFTITTLEGVALGTIHVDLGTAKVDAKATGQGTWYLSAK